MEGQGMACVRGDGHEFPVHFPIRDGVVVRVSTHFLHVRFKFVESSIYIKEKLKSECGSLLQLVPIEKTVEDGVGCWYLPVGNYKAYGLPLSLLCVSPEIYSRHSNASTVDKPFRAQNSSPISVKDVLFASGRKSLVHPVKVEKLDPIVELSSDSDKGPSQLSPSTQSILPTILSEGMKSLEKPIQTSSFGSSQKSTGVEPQNLRGEIYTISILTCLRGLANVHRSRNELSSLDIDSAIVQQVKYLPATFDGDIIFELPPLHSHASSAARNLEGMDKRYDGHPWCKLITTNIQNSDHLKFRKSYCAGHLVCVNPSCDFLRRTGSRNETEWNGCTTFPFTTGEKPPKDSTLVCKVCKCLPICLNQCFACIYYCYGPNPAMTRAPIHFGGHSHLVAKGLYRDSATEISALIADEVAKTPTATNSAIALSASKEFLSNYLFHHGDGAKKMLEGEELQEVMDRFQYLSSPSIRNVISSFHTNNHGGILDHIMTMKRNSRFEYIHDSVFPRQGKEKVYFFKMLTEGPGSGVELVKRMQTGGDLANAWMMFDHVKSVKDWTTMACHVYDSNYKKVMTIATCDMQSEDTEIQVQFWRSLNAVMERYGVESTNFKGFMADRAMANWRAVRIVYGSGLPEEHMENRERTCLLHWSTSLQKHTQKYIKEDLQHQHTLLCKQYKDSKTMEEGETSFLAIRSWWLSSGAATLDGVHHLEHWLAFWNFRYRQWGGFIQLDLSLEELAGMPSCNLSETVHNKWLQMCGNRGNNLFDATCDDSIRAWMQMTIYREFLKGHYSGSGLSKAELKLRAARRSGDPKKIAEALNTLPRIEDIGNRIPHLEGEEVFGSTKRKLDIPIGSEGDSHCPDKINFSQPCVRTRSKSVGLGPSPIVETHAHTSNVVHDNRAFESDCDTSKWHIAKISHKSSAKCHAQQRGSNIKCTSRIARGQRGTPSATYRGRKEEYGSHWEVVVDFWFCSDDIERCVKGTKRKWVIDWPAVPNVWPILAGTNLSREETLSLQDAGFCLQDQPSLSPCCLFQMSKVFESVHYNKGPPLNADVFPTVRNNKTIQRSTNAPTIEHRNKWESARNIKGEIIGVTLLPLPGLGAVVSLETGPLLKTKVYKITIGIFPSCTCPDFVNMAVSSIGGRAQYVNCKHLYYLFKYFCKMDHQKDLFIHAPSFSFNELKVLLIRAGLITVSK